MNIVLSIPELKDVLTSDLATLAKLIAENPATASYYAGMKEYVANLLMVTGVDEVKNLSSSDLESDEAAPQYSTPLNQDQTPPDPEV